MHLRMHERDHDGVQRCGLCVADNYGDAYRDCHCDFDSDRYGYRNQDGYAYADGYRDSHGYRHRHTDGNRHADSHVDTDTNTDLMPIARFRYAVAIATGPRAREFAQPFVAPEVSLVGDPAEYQVAIPANSTATLWDSSTSPVASFRLLLLRANLACEIEFTASATAVADVLNTMELQADNIPFILGSDKARGGTPGLTGTVGRITKIRAKNNDATDTAYVQIVIGA
jgi:hypothetical protein